MPVCVPQVCLPVNPESLCARRDDSASCRPLRGVSTRAHAVLGQVHRVAPVSVVLHASRHKGRVSGAATKTRTDTRGWVSSVREKKACLRGLCPVRSHRRLHGNHWTAVAAAFLIAFCSVLSVRRPRRKTTGVFGLIYLVPNVSTHSSASLQERTTRVQGLGPPDGWVGMPLPGLLGRG